MNILKKIFPKYQTKKELRERIETLQFTAKTLAKATEVKAVEIRAVETVGTFIEVPMDVIKKRVVYCMIDNIIPFVEFEIEEGVGLKEVWGRLTVVKKRGLR